MLDDLTDEQLEAELDRVYARNDKLQAELKQNDKLWVELNQIRNERLKTKK